MYTYFHLLNARKYYKELRNEGHPEDVIHFMMVRKFGEILTKKVETEYSDKIGEDIVPSFMRL